MTGSYLCPGCGGTSLVALATFPESVLTLNYLYETPEEAIAAPRAPLRLAECAQCGLVHTPAEQPEHSCYDEAYENSQEHSAVFLQHMREIRDLIGQRVRPGQPCRVLEVGCGKGGFLRLLSETDGWSGDGYDTTYTGPPAVGGFRFHQKYVTPETVRGQHYDLVVCRHVIEHIPHIGEFLRMLAALVHATGARYLLLETPDFGWIEENAAFWDIFHEHRNYFHRLTLAHLCERAGLLIREHWTTFGGQYQNILLDWAGPAGGPAVPAHVRHMLLAFQNDVGIKMNQVATSLRQAAGTGGWAIWGAGAKGVCLANYLNLTERMSPSFVIDINPAKQGSFLPGLGVPIVDPSRCVSRSVSAVVVVNPAYASEIRTRLAAVGTTAVKLLVFK
jgi:2-polyprenyl-3-methyl-5-hydroxy-6-metoxy-1,4-benzoquinol methylase